MKGSPAPLLDTPRKIVWTAVAAGLVVGAVLLISVAKDLPLTLGDTDDAVRLTLVRQLLGGQGWYDQHFMRLQAPYGTWMHWSRLVDGGIATLNTIYGVALSPRMAELATRATWPLLWVFPAIGASLAIVRRFDVRAVFICAILTVLNLELYSQFLPGRIDHHDIQIVCTLLAAAGAVWAPDRRAAILAGCATGLGLAIGLESAPFLVMIGAWFGLRYLLDPKLAETARAYGLALAGATLVVFLLQTPPSRWMVSACDALAFNLVAAVVVSGLALAASTLPVIARDPRFRIGALVVAGVLAGATYLGLDKTCIGGPMAAVDPRIYPIWLQYIQEMAPLPVFYGRDLNQALGMTLPMVLGAVALGWLLWADKARRTDPPFLLMTACFLLASGMTLAAIRASDYLFWFAVPPIALALTRVAARFEHKIAPTAALAFVASPVLLGAAVLAFTPGPSKAMAKINADKGLCFAPASYKRLATLPKGIVLAANDLGPYMLATTPHSAIGAPYHRMTWGILTTYRLLGSTDAEAEVRQLNIRYVVSCAGLSHDLDKRSFARDSLQKRLDRNDPPAWLERLSAPKEPLQIYRVSPPSTERARVSSTAK